MNGPLDGKTALVTGASRGIGAAVCRGLAWAGAAVAVNHAAAEERARQAEGVVAEIRSRGGRASAFAADVSDEDSVRDMVDGVRDSLGTIDILVLNAALSQRIPWHRISVADWDRMMSVNLRSALLCAQAVYPDMRACGYGKIITVSSVMVSLGSPGALHYVASKAGLVGLTRALAREVGPEGIRVNCVMPGAIRTEHEAEEYPDPAVLVDELAGKQSLPQRGYADDLVGTFVFLASPDSDFITGQVVCVDGGWTNR